jgi:hypothetical protein
MTLADRLEELRHNRKKLYGRRGTESRVKDPHKIMTPEAYAKRHENRTPLMDGVEVFPMMIKGVIRQVCMARVNPDGEWDLDMDEVAGVYQDEDLDDGSVILREDQLDRKQAFVAQGIAKCLQHATSNQGLGVAAASASASTAVPQAEVAPVQSDEEDDEDDSGESTWDDGPLSFATSVLKLAGDKGGSSGIGKGKAVAKPGTKAVPPAVPVSSRRSGGLSMSVASSAKPRSSAAVPSMPQQASKPAPAAAALGPRSAAAGFDGDEDEFLEPLKFASMVDTFAKMSQELSQSDAMKSTLTAAQDITGACKIASEFATKAQTFLAEVTKQATAARRKAKVADKSKRFLSEVMEEAVGRLDELQTRSAAFQKLCAAFGAARPDVTIFEHNVLELDGAGVKLPTAFYIKFVTLTSQELAKRCAFSEIKELFTPGTAEGGSLLAKRVPKVVM